MAHNSFEQLEKEVNELIPPATDLKAFGTQSSFGTDEEIDKLVT